MGENICELKTYIKKYECQLAIDMKLYDTYHKMDEYNNYGITESFSGDTQKELAEYLFKNYDKMSEYELRKIFIRSFSIKKIRSQLLGVELKNYECIPVEMNLEIFVKKAQTISRRYQTKAGGYYIEDNDWTVHNNDSRKYNIRVNEIVFENSIDKNYYNSIETQKYLKRLTKRLNCISTNIKVEQRHKNSKHDSITWILIWCKDMNRSNNEVNIGL
jgi:hypothetical protein